MARGESARHGARVVVVGAGLAGASLVRNLPQALRRPGEVLLIDRAEEYTFVPLIHEVAVGRIHPDSVRSPIPPLCEHRCVFLKADVTGIDLAGKTLETSAGGVGYEYLVLAAGSGTARPHAGVGDHFRLFRTLEDALRLRASLSDAWHAAVGPPGTLEPRPGDLTVAIVGGGATGVELAAEVAALFRYLRKRSLRDPATEPRVVLLEAEGRLIGWLPEYFHRVALEQLTRLGVEVLLNTHVEEASDGGVSAGDEWLPARHRVWVTGIEVADQIRDLPAEHDPTGRARVDGHLTLPGHPEVYVLGDAALYEDPRRGPLSPTGSVAVQQGPWAARDLGRRVRSSASRPPFRFIDRGYVVSLGPESAVAEALGVRLKGRAAQALYRSVLLYYLKSRRDRVLAASDWAMERTIGRVGFEGFRHQA
ncbi:MAG TPA: NAD(P)/FAD-dependent oxidoreductase [Rubrobacteraceae bacterium]|nr:NAD(P)/FAD-dependent oxidoreductase [Rubrobacteraceae bacterium]